MSENIDESIISLVQKPSIDSGEPSFKRTSKIKSDSKSETGTVGSIPLSGSGDDRIRISNPSMSDREYTVEGEELETNIKDNLPKLISYIEILDVPRQLQEPVDITFDYLKQISEELGLIKLCWPDLLYVTFEDRTNFPDSYLKNSNKEKLLLLYAENFRRQFCFQHPDRKPLFLACDNECGMQKMVCTTIRPTTLPYSELETWEKCSRFVADHLRYEPLEEPVVIDTVMNSSVELKQIRALAVLSIRRVKENKLGVLMKVGK